MFVASKLDNNKAEHMSLKLTPRSTRFAQPTARSISSTRPGTAYTGLCKLLDSLSQDDLKVLRDANIKWISSLADERVTKH